MSKTPDGADEVRDPDEVRARIKADPETAQIAKNLGVPFDDYVELVLEFAMNPKLQPQLHVVSDEELKALDPSYMTLGEMRTFLEDVASGRRQLLPHQVKTVFKAYERLREREALAAAGQSTEARAPKAGEQKGAIEAGDDPLGEALRHQILVGKRGATRRM